MHRLDLPLFTASGVGIVVRGEDSTIIGWIHVESGQDPEVLRLNRFRHLFLFGAAGLYFAVLAAFGALVLRLTRPVGRIAKAHERVKARNAELASLSRTDPLTGLLNRRGVEDVLDATEGADAVPSHVAIIDVDHFKAVNDERGHDEGDRVLTAVAGIMSSGVRRGDLCGRWGGEEFIIIFCGLDDASASAERIRSTVEAHAFGSIEVPLRVTITIGVAPLGNRSFADAVSAADSAMYVGKRNGRNRVVVARE
jgi:diguanylate cyclase (GGDEF)-like protein